MSASTSTIDASQSAPAGSRHGRALRALALLAAAAFFAAVPLYPLPICACATPAQAAISPDWEAWDPAARRAYLDDRLPRGLTESQVRDRLGMAQYDQYCRQGSIQNSMRCDFPHEGSAVRTNYAVLVLRYDDDRRLLVTSLLPFSRPAWD